MLAEMQIKRTPSPPFFRSMEMTRSRRAWGWRCVIRAEVAGPLTCLQVDSTKRRLYCGFHISV